MKVKHVEMLESVQVFDRLDLVLSQEQHAKVNHRWKGVNLSEPVATQIQEVEERDRN